MFVVKQYSKQRYRNIKTLLYKEAKFNQPNFLLHLLYTQTLGQQVRFYLKDAIHVFFLLIFKCNDKIQSLINRG